MEIKKGDEVIVIKDQNYGLPDKGIVTAVRYEDGVVRYEVLLHGFEHIVMFSGGAIDPSPDQG
jgi:ribosomal protein L24